MKQNWHGSFSSHNVTTVRGGVLRSYLAPAPLEDLAGLDGGIEHRGVSLGQRLCSLTKAGSSDGVASLRTVAASAGGSCNLLDGLI
jgi:hypothetical protein